MGIFLFGMNRSAMHTRTRIAWLASLIFGALLLHAPARAQIASPYAIDIPKWFTETFLDFREDVRDAAKEGKRVLIVRGDGGREWLAERLREAGADVTLVAAYREHYAGGGIHEFTVYPGIPEVLAALEDAVARIRKAGKAPGILTGVEADAKHWLEVGALFVAVGADVGILARESEKLLAKFR